MSLTQYTSPVEAVIKELIEVYRTCMETIYKQVHPEYKLLVSDRVHDSFMGCLQRDSFGSCISVHIYMLDICRWGVCQAVVIIFIFMN